jgi:hypothetical protein
MHAGMWFFEKKVADWTKHMAVYRHLKKVGKPKQDDKKNEYLTPLTLAVDVPVNKLALSSMTVSLLARSQGLAIWTSRSSKRWGTSMPMMTRITFTGRCKQQILLLLMHLSVLDMMVSCCVQR